MMNLFKIVLVLLFLWNGSKIWAQQELNKSDVALTLLMQESDRGRFAYEYNSWVEQFKAALSVSLEDSIAQWHPQILQQLELPNSGMRVYYLLKPWDEHSFEMKWLVRFQFGQMISVCDFSHEFTVPLIKKLPADSVFSVSSDNANNQFNAIVMRGATSGNSYLECPDLRSLVLFELLHDRTIDESSREALLKELNDRLMVLWNDVALFNRDWSCFKRMITLQSLDKKMRISTYLVPGSGFDSYVKGAVLRHQGDRIEVTLLKDETAEIKTPERSRLSSDKWYGALYTDLIETRHKDQTFYTLLGFKSNDGLVKTRLVDAVSFSGKKVYFGMAQFKSGGKTLYRHIFKYAAGANMMLRYDVRMKMIVFDHLTPSESFYNGQYQYYGPDFSYDGYRFEKGIWLLEVDIDLRNPKLK